MKSIRQILKKKILKEMFGDSESTHYDAENNRKVKVFYDTIDYHKNTVKAEITSGKSKGLFTVVNLDNLVELNPDKMVAEDASNLPMGAEFDSRAPWNDPGSAELQKYSFDDANQKFYITLNNGSEHEIDYIDFLEDYWKNNPGKFEEHDQKFGEMDNADAAIINSLKEEKFDFSDYLEDIARNNGWLDEESDEYDIDYETDD